ncbi:MAG: ATP-binding protein [Candidatus Saelkia tenebricola]|nr:ATP-binding protein [Candidatus Saelkia tenebricola]
MNKLSKELKILDLAKTLERTLVQVVIPIDDMTKKKENFIKISADLENIIEKMYLLEINNIKGRRLLNYVTSEYAQFKKTAFQLFNTSENTDETEIVHLATTMDKRAVNALRITEQFNQFIYEEIEVLRSSQEKTKYLLYLIILGGLLINIMLILGSILFFRRTISLPLVSLRDSVLKIGEGHLDIEVDIKLKDEIGDLAIAFNKMIDDLRSVQTQLVQAEKMASLGQLSAGVAHEIKNPLTIIMQGIEYIKSSATDAAVIDAAERIKKASLRADKIIIGLLDYSQPAPMDVDNIDINSIIEETLILTKYQATIKNISIIKKLDPKLPKINIDGNLIKQVFLNIILNAIDALTEKGTVTINTTIITGQVETECVQIIVNDTGCGIAKEDLHKIFEPFFTTKRTKDNAGLGLAVTKGLIERHHGTIKIESELGKGTNVIINLPIS